ncbi:maleylpyruvate isomerase family mycothiol-dependent enzyme [Gordonia humi]|uniref:Uncharacterized protein (TIGR03083 family) n=1 Tax=Gordonia humi TaxID=686429 RepID=A0A840EVJ9_9ACTN|nr:maleylpyruvate isomerase family mycothiol-dependent enzyme [Gordonia humi]MBB4136985.1 uncharacterized protein (TIGR03083 family) [Gordonia humi]
MTQTRTAKAPLIASLATQWQAVDDLVSPLDDAQWTADSGLPGWSVADVVAHIAGTESMLDGRTPDDTRDVSRLDHVKNPIGELNERWLDHYRARSRDELMADYRSVTAKRIADLTAMDDDAWNAETRTPVGPDTYGRFMRVRNYDCWVHEVDLRDALGLGSPSNEAPARFTLEEMATVMPFLVGKKAAAPSGSTVTFEFTGLSAATIHVAVADRAAVVENLDGPADVTLRTTVVDYARLAGGRPRAAQAEIRIEGDVPLGARIVESLHYII